ncbi:MAG: GNAT family N-acetyltransferase [Saccharospirillum sp.]|nr:GNAT family N-acetyltransferase [Saccharospirillum sp.]
MSGSECLNLVYEVDGSIVGYLAIKGGSHLYHLFVSEAHQGKGIAKQLWMAAIEGSPVKCFTLRSSLYAVPVYKRFGFEESGPAGLKDGISFQPMELNRAI